jgi:glycogen operon protein
VLIDPYARANTHALWSREAACGKKDTIGQSMRSVVVDLNGFDWEGDKQPNISKQHSIIYELHVGGFTKDPSSQVTHPGTFLGLIDKIPYLQDLGVTAVELMPVTEFDETEVLGEGPDGKPLKNYWGYAPVGFFSLHPKYCVSGNFREQIDEFRTMVREFHKAGIEVILDMVFNHTSEGDERGPTVSFRGLDNAVYYHLNFQDKSRYVDFSGCGNSLNCNHPIVSKLIRESLEYWVKEMHVDGFRLDEGSVLSRNQDGKPERYPRVLWEIELSEALADTKLFSEAWDALGLYEIGSFPGYRWSEWNGKFRDAVRRFVRGDNGMVGEMASRMAGSADLYQAGQEKPINSLNFVTCHDGFTLYDLVSYNRKHNEMNGEENRDGISENYSWNCGEEGETDKREVLRLRKRQVKNLLTILLLSQGVPMMLAGDEVMRTQRGNNNPYCQDNRLSWFDWDLVEKHREIWEFTQQLLAFRKKHGVLRRKSYFSGMKNSRGLADVEWHGCNIYHPGWDDPLCKILAVTYGAMDEQEADVFVAMNMEDNSLEVELPAVQGREWREVLQTSEMRLNRALVQVTVPARSIVVFESV